MGQDESTLSPGSTLVREGSEAEAPEEDPPVGTPEVVPTKKVLCDNCDEPATYRCKMRIDELSDVRKYPEIIDYWVPQTRIDRGMYIVAYVGCGDCVSKDVRPIFTYKPEGWCESVCMEDDYEDARV